MTWMTMLLAVGATVRLVRLIGKDSITFFFRDWLAEKTENAQTKKSLAISFFVFVEDMVACVRWCLSLWVAAFVACMAWWWGGTPWFMIPALTLTASQVTGFVTMLTDAHERDD